MPQEDPQITIWRQKYVATRKVLDQEARQRQDLELISAQNAVLDFLRGSHFDSIIRQILREKSLPHTATKMINNVIPLDGQPKTKYSPAFVLDHSNQWGYSRQLEFPGMRYFFRIGLDQTVISVTICRNDQGSIFPYFFITHEDGRSHQIDWQVAYKNPSDDQLSTWLRRELK